MSMHGIRESAGAGEWVMGAVTRSGRLIAVGSWRCLTDAERPRSMEKAELRRGR